jgi:hypothetical protein
MIAAQNLLTVLKSMSGKIVAADNSNSMNNMAAFLANMQSMQAMQSIPMNNWNAASLAGLSTISPAIALQLARQTSLASFPAMSLGGQFVPGYSNIPQINIPFTRPTADSSTTVTHNPTIAFEIPWGWNC